MLYWSSTSALHQGNFTPHTSRVALYILALISGRKLFLCSESPEVYLLCLMWWWWWWCWGGEGARQYKGVWDAIVIAIVLCSNRYGQAQRLSLLSVLCSWEKEPIFKHWACCSKSRVETLKFWESKRSKNHSCDVLRNTSLLALNLLMKYLLGFVGC